MIQDGDHEGVLKFFFGCVEFFFFFLFGEFFFLWNDWNVNNL